LCGTSSSAASAATLTAPTRGTTTGATCTTGRGSGLLLQSSPRASSHSRLLRLTLRLEYRRAKQRDLLALGDAAQHFGIVEIADANAHHPRLELSVLLYEHDLPAGTTSASTTSAARELATGSATTGGTARPACSAASRGASSAKSRARRGIEPGTASATGCRARAALEPSSLRAVEAAG
jgi:hypothetical protein